MSSLTSLLPIAYAGEILGLIGLYFFARWYVNNPPKNEVLLVKWEQKAKLIRWHLKHPWVTLGILLLALIQTTVAVVYSGKS